MVVEKPLVGVGGLQIPKPSNERYLGEWGVGLNGCLKTAVSLLGLPQRISYGGYGSS